MSKCLNQSLHCNCEVTGQDICVILGYIRNENSEEPSRLHFSLPAHNKHHLHGLGIELNKLGAKTHLLSKPGNTNTFNYLIPTEGD